MKNIIFSRLVKVCHPFLLAIFPFLFFLSNNPAELDVFDIFIPLGVTLLITGIILLVARVLLGSITKAATAVSLCLFIFFSYGYFYDALSGIFVVGVEVGRARYLLSFYAVMFTAGMAFIFFTRRSLKMLQQFLNVVTLVLVAMSVITITPRLFNNGPDASGNDLISPDLKISLDQNTFTVKPDIYYIILDAYGNERTLAGLYDYDNTPHLTRLRDKGFYVASKSTSNFAETGLSISSSLNMEYVNYFADLVAGREKGFDPAVEHIQNSKVWQFLRNQGYKFVTFRSIWGKTGYNTHADVNLVGGKFNELSILIVNTTLLRASLLYTPIHAYFFSDLRERILYTFEQLGAMPKLNMAGSPKFIFAHIMSPHPPFIFGPNGEEVQGIELNFNPDDTKWGEAGKQRYTDQITFLNTKVEAMVEQILATSKTPPIIVVQGDHGPWATISEDRSNNHFYRERMRIFNAYYLPGDDKKNLYESITPVNTFRLIFDTYFGVDFPLLEDKNYFSNTVYHPKYPKTPYKFIDVTDIVTDWSE